MHARTSHHSVDEHYVNDMCGFFFETWMDCDNMVSAMFDETLKDEVAIVAARYEAVGTAHGIIGDPAVVDDQEQDKVIEEFLVIISVSLL